VTKSLRAATRLRPPVFRTRTRYTLVPLHGKPHVSHEGVARTELAARMDAHLRDLFLCEFANP
jgi:hypothetical protein